jgi:alpha-1,2-glucosyltransferase
VVGLGSKNYHTTWIVGPPQAPFVPHDNSIIPFRRYLLSVFLHRVFMFKCNLALLRLTTTLTLFALPPVLTRLLAFHQRRRPPPTLAPSIEALVLSTFPIAWFFGFLYYTEVPSLVSVLCTVVAATQNRHWLAGLVGALARSRFS